MPSSQGLLAELASKLPETSDAWRSTALRRIVDLFLSGAALYTAEQVALFDEVIGRLLPNVERSELAEVSHRLAPIANTPLKVIATLARHADIAICGPILEQAKDLQDIDLVEIADQDRIDVNLLMKIAGRPQLSAAVTDVLLKRGNKAIQRTVIDNPNARVSEAGFARVIMGAKGDKSLAAAIAARDDVPRELRLWLAETMSQ